MWPLAARKVVSEVRTAVYRPEPADGGGERTVTINWIEESHHRATVRVPADFDAVECDLENGLAELSDDGFEYLERSVSEVRDVEHDPTAEFFNPVRYDGRQATSPADEMVIPGSVWTRFLEQEMQLDRERPGDVSLSAVVSEIGRLMGEQTRSQPAGLEDGL